MLNKLQSIQNKQEKLAIGLISGTSVDGVDTALVKIKSCGLDTEVDLLHFQTFPYPDGLKKKILKISTPGCGSVDEICLLNILLGEIFSDAVKSLVDETGRKSEEIDFIGSHGQTVQHIPVEIVDFNYRIKGTLQLAEPSVISKRTGILTVADFRPADMALGGQGAPLVPYFDYLFFRSTKKNVALLNLGGIANFTILKKNGKLDDVLAYDTGPANMVIDFLMQKLFEKPYDEGGKIAKTGRVSNELLAFGLQHPYFQKTPPKSTGREEFGDMFATEFLAFGKGKGLKRDDIITTAAELTVQTIVDSYKKDIATKIPIDEVIVSGGGARNSYLIKSLRQKLSAIELNFIDKYGISSDAKEAVCFAVLANDTLAGNPNNVPTATGATHRTVLGKICL